MHYIILFIFLILVFIPSLTEINAAKINKPIVTEYINDISGSDIFKTTVGITNVKVDTGLVEICVNTEQPSIEKVCDITDVGKKFLNNFGNSTCLTCIITVGTFVFPSELVPINTVVTACATVISKNVFEYSCNTTQNKKDLVPEDIVIRINE